MAGRGGAGNILALQQQTERIVDDVEANLLIAEPAQASTIKNEAPQSSAADPTAPRDQPDPAATKHEEQQYAYTGRGGAGNYYIPSDLDKTGRFVDAHRSHILGDGTPAPGGKKDHASVPPSRWQGRGGAGNYSWGVAESEERAIRKKIEDEKLKEEKLKADVEKGVEESLPVPPKAKLYGSGNELV